MDWIWEFFCRTTCRLRSCWRNILQRIFLCNLLAQKKVKKIVEDNESWTYLLTMLPYWFYCGSWILTLELSFHPFCHGHIEMLLLPLTGSWNIPITTLCYYWPYSTFLSCILSSLLCSLSLPFCLPLSLSPFLSLSLSIYLSIYLSLPLSLLALHLIFLRSYFLFQRFDAWTYLQ